MDLQGLLEALEQLVPRVQLAVQEVSETQGLLVLLDNRDPLVQMVHLDQVDPQDFKDQLAQLVQRVFLVFLEELVELVLLVRLDPPEIKVPLALLVHLDRQELRVQLEPLVTKVLLGSPVHPATQDLLDRLECKARKAIKDH